MAKIADIREPLFSLVKKIPMGKVSTYQSLALLLSTHPRVIGRALHTNEDGAAVPCHRVVHSNGALAGGYAFGGPAMQKEKLVSEGVVFVGERVNLTASFWHI